MNKPLFSFVFFSLITGFLFAQAPTGLQGMGYRTTVHLQWDDYTAFEVVGFNIYRSTISGNYGAPARQVGAYNECTDYNLDPSSTYFYKISAFDGVGNESPLSNEITVATNDNDYSIVASLDLLIPIYTGGMTATAPDEIKASLEHARQFFFRNTFGQLNLNYHYWIIPGYPPFNSNGQATLATIEADLLAKGIQPSQYDAVHTMALQLNGFFGGAWYFGGQTAGSMGYDWTHYDPVNHYTQGNSWLFTHEFGHALDLVIAYGSGYPEMLFNHYGDNYPLPASIGVFDAGSGFDGMAMILRLFPHHLDYDAPWDGYFEVVDNDGDGLADNDSRVPMDETRFGSSADKADTDGDGLADLAEYFAGTQLSADPTNPDTDNDGLTDGDDVYPVSNFAKLNEKTSGTIVIDGVMGAAEGWHPMVSEPFFSMIPGATLNTFTTWDDNNFYFTFQSNQQLKYFLQMDASGEDGIYQSDVRFPGGNYANLNENSWGDSYFETAELVIRSDGAQVYLKEMPIAGSQVSTTFVGGIYTTEVRLPQNIGPGYGWVYTAPGTPTIAVQSFQEGDIIGIDVTAIPLSEANGNVAAEWFGYYTKKSIILMNDFRHLYDMELVAGGNPPGDYCNVYSNFPWEDWIAHVTVGSIDNASGKTPYSNFTNLSTNLAAGSSPNISLTTGFSYFTWDEHWRVWIDFNQDGDFSDTGEMAFSGILNAPPNGTPSSILNGHLTIPVNAKLGATRMRVSMKRGAFPTPCEILPFGEIEDYTVTIIPGTGGVADLELSASANPTTISSGYVHYVVNLTNQGPGVANNVSVKHSKSGNFFGYSSPTTTIGSFSQMTGVWSIPSIPAGATHSLEFDGLIVDMITLQTDFFEVIASSADDPDSTPNNDNGAKTPDEDDEAAVTLFPSVVADLLVANVNVPTSSNAGDNFDVHFDLQNAGTQPAFNTVQAVFLSNDNQWDTGDSQVGISNPTTVGPNTTLPQSISVNISAGTLAGNYYLLIVADVNSDILESNENNNIAVVPFEVKTGTAFLPNLSIANLEVIPGSSLCFTNPGEAFGFLGGTILNSGLAATGPFKLTATISKDDQISANDVLWQNLPYNGVAANSAVGFEFDNPVPASLAPGLYFIILQIDPEDMVVESNEADNVRTISIQVGAPDFTVSAVSGLPVNTNSGTALNVTIEVTNLIGFPLLELNSGLTIKIYLSTDNVFNSFGDQEIGTGTIAYDQFSNGPLFVNGIAAVTFTAQIPGGTPVGGYFMFVNITNHCEQPGNNNYSNAIPIQIDGGTPGTYCNSYSEFPWEDWISRVEVANLVNTSGKSYYSDFTAKTANVNAGQSYPVKLGTGYSYFTWDEYWRIWIDFNKDGDFTDAGEMVFSDILNAPPNGTPKAILNGSIAIPSNAPTGTTRMRVSMKRNAFATPCEILTFGEVEDYTVNIGSGPNCTIDYGTSNTFCQDNGTPNDPADDTFTFDILVVGTGVSQSWVMTWNGGSITGTFTIPKTVGPFSIAAFQSGLNFTIADNLDPNCSILGTVYPPQPCSTVLPDCGFSKNYSEGESFTGFFAEQNGSSYRVFGSAGNSIIKLNTDLDGNVTSSDIGQSYGTALRDGNFLSISLVGTSVQLTKKNSLGNMIWSNTYPVPNAVSIGLGNALETPAGDLVVVGSWSEIAPPSQHKIFALKTNSNGVQQWLSSSDFNEPTLIPLGVNLVKYTISNGYLISILDHSSEQKYIGKLSPNGTLILEKLIGGFFTDFGDADESANGRIMYSYVSRPAGGPGYNHVGYTVIDASGNNLWGISGETIAGLISNPGFINFSKPKVTHTANGGFGVSFNGPTAGFYLAKLDADGNILWNQNATTLDILVPMADFLTEATDGGILSTGQQDGKLWLMKTDAQGGICGPQPPGDYCLPYSNFPWEDWIAKVSLHTLDNSSGKSPYSNFTAISTTLEKGMDYPIQLTTGYSYFTWDEYWSVWIDLNHDHLFTQNELLFSKIMTAPANGTSSKIISGNINIPATAKNGPTRMRVIMKRGAFADPCENIPFGEIEDYSVNIIDNIISPNMGDRATDISFKAVLEKTWVNLYSVFKLPENAVQIEIEKSADNISFDLLKTINDRKEKNKSHLISTIDEQPFDGLNYYRLLFILENGDEIYGPEEMVDFNQPLDFTLFPNPTSSELFIYLNEKKEGEIKWKINDAFGRQLRLENINQNDGTTYQINIDDFKPGMYYLFVEQTGRKAVGKRFVVAR